jgi:hypothetical protein
LRVWVPETVLTAVDLPLRHRREIEILRPAPPTGSAANDEPPTDELDRPGLTAIAPQPTATRPAPPRDARHPSTILRWHRPLVARRWTTQPVRPGRPAIPAGVRALVIPLAELDSGRTQRGDIDGSMATSPASATRSAPPPSAKILHSAGIDPSPRGAGPSWNEFLRTQAHAILACELFHLYTITQHRLYVLFGIEHVVCCGCGQVADWSRRSPVVCLAGRPLAPGTRVGLGRRRTRSERGRPTSSTASRPASERAE